MMKECKDCKGTGEGPVLEGGYIDPCDTCEGSGVVGTPEHWDNRVGTFTIVGKPGIDAILTACGFRTKQTPFERMVSEAQEDARAHRDAQEAVNGNGRAEGPEVPRCVGCGLKKGDNYPCEPSVSGDPPMCNDCRLDRRAAPTAIMIESPYSGDIARNEEYARRCMLDSLERGEAPIVPHLLYPQVWDDMDPELRESALVACKTLREAAGNVAFYTDYGFSKGMKRAEREAAGTLGGFVEYRTIGPNPEPAGMGSINWDGSNLCGCQRCHGERRIKADDPYNMMGPGFRYACNVCGNKRCPHHKWHGYDCTNSNEPDQPLGKGEVAQDEIARTIGPNPEPNPEFKIKAKPISEDERQKFAEAERAVSTRFKDLQTAIHQNAIAHGWWDCPTCGTREGGTHMWVIDCKTCNGSGKHRNIGESLALIHSEVSEALEAKRDPEDDDLCAKCDGLGSPYDLGDIPCKKCDGTGHALGGSRFGEELADIVIRVMDLAEHEGVDLLEVIKLKHAYNVTRPHKHGKEF